MPTWSSSMVARVSLRSGPRKVIEPVSSSVSAHLPSMTKVSCQARHASMSAIEMVSLRLGTSTLAGCLVASRNMPTSSLMTACFQVNESTFATRLHGRSPSSKRQLQHSHFLVLLAILLSSFSPLRFW